MNSIEDSSYSVFKQDGSHQFYCRWSVQEDLLLSKAVADHGPHKWTLVSRFIPGRTAVQCSTRWFGALNPNVHKGRWSEHEDEALTKAVQYFETITKDSNLPWNRIAENIPYRTGIQCQARWTEALDPAVRKGRWHQDEDKLLATAITKYGCCWIRVASMIPTRTQRQCRTRWNQIHSQQLKSASTKAANHRRTTSSFKYTSPLPNSYIDLFSPLLLNNDNTSFQSKSFDFYQPQRGEQLSCSPVDSFLAQYGSSPTTVSRSSSISSYLLTTTSLPEQQKFQDDLSDNLLFATDFDFLL
ncbi:hypothetical protein MFLAVUS_009223 [Mucor flavus]|uniref:Uncharacterized protein n=1 Tax=Mucor flavus TaxID=439312 RepID=A0ABP9Z9G6_9FUNG